MQQVSGVEDGIDYLRLLQEGEKRLVGPKKMQRFLYSELLYIEKRSVS